jgi:hypothetical protein
MPGLLTPAGSGPTIATALPAESTESDMLDGRGRGALARPLAQPRAELVSVKTVEARLGRVQVGRLTR